jgi:hypothetical protein
MTTGAVFRPQSPPEQLRGAVEAAEAAGVDELWLWEDCFLEAGLTAAAAALAWSDRITIALAGEVSDGVLLDSVSDPDVVRRARALVGHKRVVAYTEIEPSLGAGAVHDWIAELEHAGADGVILQGTDEHPGHLPLIAHLAG